MYSVIYLYLLVMIVLDFCKRIILMVVKIEHLNIGTVECNKSPFSISYYWLHSYMSCRNRTGTKIVLSYLLTCALSKAKQKINVCCSSFHKRKFQKYYQTIYETNKSEKYWIFSYHFWYIIYQIFCCTYQGQSKILSKL